MTHDAFAEKLLDLAYGELSPREAGKVEAHAASCEACRAELGRIRETRSLMARLPEDPAPEKGERILFAAAREAAEGRVPRRRVPPWLWRASLVAASLVFVVAVSYRVAEMRSARMLSKPSDEALLGGPYAPSPPAGPTAAAPPGATAAPREAPAGAERAERNAARADRREAPAMVAAEAPRRDEGHVDEHAARADRDGGMLAGARPGAEKKAAPPVREERPSRAFAEAPPVSADAAAPAAPPPPFPAPARREAPQAQASEAAPSRPGAAPEMSARPEEQARDRELSAKPAKPSGARRAAAPESLGYAGSKAAAGAAPRFESRTFERCEGESRRRVEVDAQGRVVRYVREGTFDGRRVRIVHVFAPDGSLARATAEDLDQGVTVDPRALGIELAERAEDAGIDAPRRCGR
jgi:hypothetical protein